jgi:hypothetical protein
MTKLYGTAGFAIVTFGHGFGCVQSEATRPLPLDNLHVGSWHDHGFAVVEFGF